jgi:hypothetical protein
MIVSFLLAAAVAQDIQLNDVGAKPTTVSCQFAKPERSVDTDPLAFFFPHGLSTENFYEVEVSDPHGLLGGSMIEKILSQPQKGSIHFITSGLKRMLLSVELGPSSFRTSAILSPLAMERNGDKDEVNGICRVTQGAGARAEFDRSPASKSSTERGE